MSIVLWVAKIYSKPVFCSNVDIILLYIYSVKNFFNLSFLFRPVIGVIPVGQ